MTNDNDGTYDVEYLVTEPGEYLVGATVDGERCKRFSIFC